jgi:hypothetical protein
MIDGEIEWNCWGMGSMRRGRRLWGVEGAEGFDMDEMIWENFLMIEKNLKYIGDVTCNKKKDHIRVLSKHLGIWYHSIFKIISNRQHSHIPPRSQPTLTPHLLPPQPHRK